jgi:hypothetical protein
MKGTVPMRKAATVVTLLLVLALAGCGGGGGGGSTGDAPTAAGSGGSAAPPQAAAGGKAETPAKQGDSSSKAARHPEHRAGGDSGGAPSDTSASFTPPAHHDSGGGAAQFERKGGDNSIQEFGSETAGSDLQAAATALHGYLDARAVGAWSDACSYLASGVAASLAQLGGSGAGKAGCPELLASLSVAVSPAALREAAEADVAALRAEGERAFILFRGAHGTDYFMPMAEEAGEWKVAAIAPSAIP